MNKLLEAFRLSCPGYRCESDVLLLITSQAGLGEMTSSAEPREAAVTRMLVVVCVVYAVCTLPTVAHAFFRYFLPDFDSKEGLRNTFYATLSLTHLMASCNASGNFLIYLSVSTKFKQTLKGMLYRGRSGGTKDGRKMKDLDTTTQTYS